MHEGQRPVAQPVQQGRSIGRGQQLGQSVAAVRRSRASGHGQCMQVVVAQQTLGSVAQCGQPAQHRQRGGATVDQVAQQHHTVAAGREI